VIASVVAGLELLLGVTFAIAAHAKVHRFRDTIKTIADYDLFPRSLAPVIAVLLVVVETIVAISFITGWAVRAIAPVTIGIIALFGTAATINLRRGRIVKCGCFGDSEELSLHTLARLTLMLAASAAILVAETLEIGQRASLITLIGQPASVALTEVVRMFIAAAAASCAAIWILNVREVRVVLRRTGGSLTRPGMPQMPPEG